MKATHFSVMAMTAAVVGIAVAIVAKDSESLATSILALVTAFLPAVQLVLPWFSSAKNKGDMPVFQMSDHDGNHL